MINFLLQFEPPTQAMFYFVNKYENFFVLDEEDGLEEINSSINENAMALKEGYAFKSKLYNLAKTKFKSDYINLGVIILLINFAKFYSRNQYILFSNFFKHIEEIKYIEHFLTHNAKKLKFCDLGIDSKYGILAQKENFTSNALMTIFDFIVFFEHFHEYPKEELIITYFKKFDIRIVESLYNLTSSPTVKSIKEANVIIRPILKYNFENIIKTDQINADFWFILPPKIIWFAYMQGQFFYTGYVEYSLDEQFKRFNNFNKIIVGYIYKNKIYPLFFDCRPHWHQSVELFKQHNIVSYLIPISLPCTTTKNFYFVKEGDNNIYKYVK